MTANLFIIRLTYTFKEALHNIIETKFSRSKDRNMISDNTI